MIEKGFVGQKDIMTFGAVNVLLCVRTMSAEYQSLGILSVLADLAIERIILMCRFADIQYASVKRLCADVKHGMDGAF